jgi:flagellar motor switch/type III secretory pathway protein FliN
VPVVVTLASTRLSLQRILQLGPGAIVPLAKSCEDPLILQVGNHDLAVGEAVKVGEKFGIRINSMVMPEEKFVAIGAKGKSKS